MNRPRKLKHLPQGDLSYDTLHQFYECFFEEYEKLCDMGLDFNESFDSEELLKKFKKWHIIGKLKYAFEGLTEYIQATENESEYLDNINELEEENLNLKSRIQELEIKNYRLEKEKQKYRDICSEVRNMLDN